MNQSNKHCQSTLLRTLSLTYVRKCPSLDLLILSLEKNFISNPKLKNPFPVEYRRNVIKIRKSLLHDKFLDHAS